LNEDLIYVLEPIPRSPTKTIFLAGPVPREADVESWHDEAAREIGQTGFRGSVVVPRPRPGAPVADTDEQRRWERDAMLRSDALLFWIPRVLWTLPGLTSNLEWGIWHDSGKAVLGAPPWAPRMSYLRFYAEIGGAPQATSLPDAAQIAVDLALGRSVGRRAE
jgi:hypothetical protein